MNVIVDEQIIKEVENLITGVLYHKEQMHRKRKSQDDKIMCYYMKGKFVPGSWCLGKENVTNIFGAYMWSRLGPLDTAR